MLDRVRQYSKAIIVVAVIGLGILGINMDFSQEWFLLLLPGTATAGVLLFLIIKTADTRREIEFLDLKEFEEHQVMTIDSLEEIFLDSPSSEDFNLRSMLTGAIKGDRELRAPHSGVGCYGYKLKVGLLKSAGQGNKALNYSYLLLEETENAALTLQQGNDSVKIGKTPLLNLKTIRSEVISWNSFNGLDQELKKKINNVISLKKINRAHFTGMIIIEEIIEEDEEYTVYGVAKKVNNTIILEGNNIVNNQNSLYITSVTSGERERQILGLKKSLRARSAVAIPLIFLLLSAPGYYFYSIFYFSRGQVYYRENPVPYRVEMEHAEGSSYDNPYWDFESNGDYDRVRLLGDNDKPIHGNHNTVMRLGQSEKTTSIYTVGKDSLMKWANAFWSLELTYDLPEPGAPVEMKKGRIYIKNRTDLTFKIKFVQADGMVKEDDIWTWDPQQGVEYTYGTYAIDTETIGDKETEHEIILSTGDTIIILKDDKVARSFLLGYSEEVEYEPVKGIWQLALNTRNTADRSGKIYVKNPSDADYDLYILDFYGKYLYDSYWEYTAGTNKDSEEGHFLIYSYDDGTSDTIFLNEGMGLKIIRTVTTTYWEGKLGESPYAKYDWSNRTWEINVE